MNKPPAVDNPFLERQPVRLGFGMMLIMLLMVVAAGVGLLGYLAMRVPAITSELNAWLGRTDTAVDLAEARRAQVIFALFLYTSPLALGMFVYVLHWGINWIDRLNRQQLSEEDEQYRME